MAVRKPHFQIVLLAVFLLSLVSILAMSNTQICGASSAQDLHVTMNGSGPCEKKTSFEECIKAADAGSFSAMNRLGEMYRDGEGVTKDLNAAKRWLGKAAAGGNSDAMNNLGLLHSYHRGFPTNYNTALDWFQRSAKLGNAEAMNNLGMMYLEARGVNRNYTMAREWFERAVALNNNSARIDLGHLYQHGLGVPQDIPKAIQLYEAAAANGYAHAIEMLGLLYESGTGVPKDMEKAREYFEKAASLEDVGSMFELGQIYEGAKGNPRDPAKAKYWYERAASKADKAAANEWISDWAMERLGDSYQSGIFTERDYHKALDWFKKAVDMFDSPNAMDRIANFYEYGYGVSKDAAEAEKWHARAAALRPPPKPIIPQCAVRDVTTRIRVFDLPAYQVVAVESRNATKAVCMLGNYTLGPNQVAHTWQRWRKAADDGTTAQCQRNVSGVPSFGVMLLSTTLLPPACSDPEIHGYAAGPFVPDWPPVERSAPEPKLTLSATKAHYMRGEYVPLHVTVSGAGAAPLSQQGCPVLLRAITFPTGQIRIEEMTPTTPRPGYGFGMAVNCRDGKSLKTGLREFEFEGNSYLDDKAPNTIRFLTLAGTSSYGEVRLVESNPITVSFKAPAEMPRRWGPTVQGVRVALSLDKLAYAVGEEIPLHIAAQVVSPDHPVYAEPDILRGAFFSDFSGAFHLTLIGKDGVIAGNEEPDNLRPHSLGGSSGPALCPSPLEKDKVYPLERSAKRLGLLPRQPGKYKVFVTWSPYLASDPPCAEKQSGGGERRFRPFVTVTSEPLMIQITGKPVTEAGVPSIPVYIGWHKDFRVVNTSLGEATALEDTRSHLQWLRLTLTKMQSKDSLQKQMARGERLEGWRFATREEVKQFFANFTGSADGQSKDSGMERALQHLLGGPLLTQRNTETGWSDRSTYAVIAETRPAGPDERPANPAVPAGTPPPCASCGYGFVIWTATVREATINNHIDVTINPGEKGWYVSDQGVYYGLNSAILLVRNAP